MKKNKLKTLSKKELAKGKAKVKIYGTKLLMPWEDVYNRIRMGVPIKHIAEKYGNERLITLWAKEDEIDVIQGLSDVVDSEIVQRNKMQVIEEADPAAAKTLKEVANEYAPNVARDLVLLTASMIKKGQTKLNDDDCSTNDMRNIAAAVQTMTDTAEVSERFSTNAGQGNISIAVEGFTFKKPQALIDAEIIEKKEE